MSSLRDPSHPIWRIGTILAFGVLIIGVNFINAKSFNRDDWDRIMQIFAGAGAGAGLKSWLTGGKGGQGKGDGSNV